MTLVRKKSFWQKPEGVTGAIFLIGLVGLIGYAVVSIGIAALTLFFSSPLGIGVALFTLGLLLWFAIDGRARKLVSYMYQSVMRAITGLFVKIDPISILKGYVDDLRYNLKKMNMQIGKLRKEKHAMMELIFNNEQQIKSNMELASKAKAANDEKTLILNSRKAARLKESNGKLAKLLGKMQVIQRVLVKMRDNSEILVEDTEDQVRIKEKEHKAIMASHNAMKSAMNIIKGDKDKKQMFDMAMEALADDVSSKVGEMEEFMDMSESFMKSIDVENGIFEEKGLKMLEKWEKDSSSLLLGDAKADLLRDEPQRDSFLDLNEPRKEKQKIERTNEYDDFFDE